MNASRFVSRFLLGLLLIASFVCSFAALAADDVPHGVFRVACLGDSLTQGARVNATKESYPAVLQQLLGADFSVRNFGVGGSTLIKAGKPNAWSQLPKAKAFEPHIVIVNFGVNDTRSRTAQFWQHIETFPADLRELVQQITALPTGPRVILCAPTAIQSELPELDAEKRADRAERQPRLEQLRAIIRQVAKEFATNNVTVVELGTVTEKRPELYTDDGVHLKAAGYRLMAETLVPSVRSAAARPFGGLILRGHLRTQEDIDKSYAEIPPVQFQPSTERGQHLTNTLARLQRGERLRVVMLGDSIINDTSRSDWERLVMRDYPGSDIVKITSVRGSTGCWFYKEPPRVQVFVTDFQPDLVIIGGISQNEETDSIREVIQQIHAVSPAEILLMSGPFGPLDPQKTEVWHDIVNPPAKSYRVKLPQLAVEVGAEYFDIQKAWAEYVRASGRETKTFMRDVVHANAQGEQILGRILERFFAPRPAR